MDNQTFRTRLADLMQKSRKALRLYTSMGNSASSELGELQAQQWKEINSDLLKQVALALESPNPSNLAASVFSLRDKFYHNWRLTEADVHLKQKELICAAENGDFIKASILGRELVLLKARELASQAVHHELQEVLQRSKLQQPSASNNTIELSNDKVVEAQLAEANAARPRATVISINRRSMVA